MKRREWQAKLARLDEELVHIAKRLHEIELMDSQADRRIRSADNVDTALSKLVGFFGIQTTTGQFLEEIRNAFVTCQFLKREEADAQFELKSDEPLMCCVCGTRAANRQCPGCKGYFCDLCFMAHLHDNAKYLEERGES